MRSKTTLIILLIFLIPSTLFALEEGKTGYDLYHNLQLLDNSQNPEDMTKGLLAVSYLRGCVDGLIFMQDVHYNKMFPPNKMTKEERVKISKKLNFHQINMPAKDRDEIDSIIILETE